MKEPVDANSFCEGARQRLTTQEQYDFQQAEQVIDRGLKSFIEVGKALLTIREGKFYKQGWDTFEDYCRDRWKISRPRAYELIGASKVAGNLSAMADTPTTW
jgi:hypothetical protein